VFRAVLDANVFISALIQPEGNPGRILRRLLETQAFSLVLSEAILHELRHSLEYPKVRKRLVFSTEELDEKIGHLQSVAVFVEGEVRNRIVTADPDDDKYIAAAHDGLATFLVTGDQDLLQLGHHGEIRILSPRQFLAVLDSSA
jgi:putative PIN family toxin of toxin-antitoxin system